jgi:hypothetical protein
MCTPADGNYTITYTAASGNSAACPAAPATEMATWPDDSGTAFPGCTCAGSTLTCMGSTTDDAGTLDETITYTFTSTNFTGTVVAMENGITCNYTFDGVNQ